VTRPCLGVVVGWVLLVTGASVVAATVTWDANTSTTGAQDGGGTWDTSGNNWWNGSANVPWPNTTADEAVFGAGSGAGAAGTVTVGSVTANKITLNAAGSGSYILAGGTITLDGTNPTIGGAATATISATLSGTSVRKTGGGILWVSGNNNYTGTTDIQGGLWIVQNNNALGTAAAGTNVGSAATLDLQVGSNLTLAEPITLNSVAGAGNRGALRSWSTQSHTLNGSLTLGATSGIQVADGNGTLTVNGLIDDGAGTYGLVKFGAGTLVLTAANTYGGGTTIGAGTLKLDAGNDRLPVSTSVTLGGGFNGATGDSGKLALNGRNQTLAGLATAGTGAAGSNRVVGGSATLSTLTLDVASGTTSFAGTLGGGGANENNLALTKSGAGTLELAGANSYSGATKIIGGVLKLGAANALPTGTTLDVGSSAPAVASTFDLNGFDQTVGALQRSSGATGGPSYVTNSGPSIRTLTVNQSATTTYSGSMTGNLALTKQGGGILWLPGANSYVGPTDVRAGLLIVQNNSALGASTAGTTVQNGATLDLQTGSNLTLAEPITLNGVNGAGNRGALRSYGAFSHTLNGPLTLGSDGGINVENASGALTVNGAIDDGSGAYGLTKFGNGKLVLTAANSFDGALSVNGGTLLVDGSLHASSNVTVNGGRLGGSGTVGGTVTVNTAGSISAGDSPGTLAIGGAYTQTGTMLVEIGGTAQGSTYDWLDVGGAATLGGTLQIDLMPGFVPETGATFDVLTAGSITDNGLNLVFDSGDLGAAQFWKYSIVNGNTTLQLEVGVPEPSTVTLLGIGAMGLLLLVWQRRPHRVECRVSSRRTPRHPCAG